MNLDLFQITNFNPNTIFIDSNILRAFDKRYNCPLFWYREAEFVIDPREIMDQYLMTGEEAPPMLFSKLNRLVNKEVLFKRVEKQIFDDDFLFANSPGYFNIFIKNNKDEWVQPNPNYVYNL